MNGFDHRLRRSLPKSPKIGLVQMPMLITINPPQRRAKMFRIVPQEPRLNHAPLWGQPRVRAISTPKLHMK